MTKTEQTLKDFTNWKLKKVMNNVDNKNYNQMKRVWNRWIKEYLDEQSN